MSCPSWHGAVGWAVLCMHRLKTYVPAGVGCPWAMLFAALIASGIVS